MAASAIQIRALRLLTEERLRSQQEDAGRGGRSLMEQMTRLTAPTVGVASTLVSKAAFTDRQIAYQVPEGSSASQQQDLIYLCFLCSRNAEDPNVKRWCTLLLTMALALYPSLVTEGALTDVNIITITGNQMTAITNLIAHLKPIRTEPTEAEFRQTLQLVGQTGLAMLPLPTISSFCVVEDGVDSSIWYGLFSVWVFTISKNLKLDNLPSLNEKRFSALRSKFSWEEGINADILGGNGCPDEFGYGMMAKAWIRLFSLKRAIFSYAACIPDIPSSLADQVFYTTIRLMKFADMAHVAIIMQFMRAHEWVVNLPALKNDIKTFKEGVVALNHACPDLLSPLGSVQRNVHGEVIKDTRYLPFLKMIHGDNLDIAKRDSMPTLLYVAVKVQQRTDLPLAHYTLTKNFDAALQEFDRAEEAFLHAQEQIALEQEQQ